jgi:hypothetical protein
MLPYPPRGDLPNGNRVNAISLAQGFTRDAKLAISAYGQNLICGKLCEIAPLAKRTPTTTLGHLVVDVVGIGAQKQMVGIDARWAVTPMQYL